MDYSKAYPRSTSKSLKIKTVQPPTTGPSLSSDSPPALDYIPPEISSYFVKSPVVEKLQTLNVAFPGIFFDSCEAADSGYESPEPDFSEFANAHVTIEVYSDSKLQIISLPKKTSYPEVCLMIKTALGGSALLSIAYYNEKSLSYEPLTSKNLYSFWAEKTLVSVFCNTPLDKIDKILMTHMA
jgi:hypothetical protein